MRHKHKIFRLSDVYCGEKIRMDEPGDDIERLTGEIILNRIVGIAYDNMELSTLPKEIRKTLEILREQHIRQTGEFLENLTFMAEILSGAAFPYALLKGAFLTAALYERGNRTSNDIDILVESHNVTALQNLLREHGFIQGYCRNGEIIPAARREILHARLNYGETVPFVRRNERGILEVDINFSLDYKPDGEQRLVAEMLRDPLAVSIGEKSFYTLNTVDFLIQLCCHLYKEATTYEWVRYRRDLMLYKFSDIRVFLHEYGGEDYFRLLLERIRALGLEKPCYYTLENAGKIYPALEDDAGFVQLKHAIRPDDLRFMKQIADPVERKLYRYEMEFEEWFVEADRPAHLMEA